MRSPAVRAPRAGFVPSLLALLALSAGAVRADFPWTIPGIVHADGLNATHFVSDLTLTNPGAGPAHVTLSFFPAAAPLVKALTLAPGETIVASDVARVHFGVTSGAGGLAVSSDQPLLVRARTYNAAATGTYGVALPVVPADRLLGPGDVGDSLWVTQDASGSAGYRTNVAVVFPDEEGGEAAVTVYDADGNEVGHQDFALTAPGLQQFSVGTFAGSVPVGRAQVQVFRGRAAGYSVVVDNVTGDSSLFAFEQLPAGWQDVLVNGVARANGRNAAFFRTDGRFYNPTATDATVNVSFHANQSANPSPATAQFVLPAGKIRDVVDVLDALLQLPVGSAGALRFQSTSPVAILCRTSNVDPSGTRPGTFGSQQKPTSLLSFLMSGDAGAVVTGIRQNAAFRTNVGFAAGAEGASYTLTLKTASGGTAATASGSLGVFGWTQPSIQDLFPGVPIPDDATLQVKVTSGSVDVFDSSIDNASGDPVVTPIAALPAAIPSSATIGPAGGSIRSDDGVLTLRIPAGALAAPTPISIATVANDAPGALGSAYDVSPGGLAFAKPALLSLRYGGEGLPVSGIEAVAIAVLGDSGWGALTGGRVDTTARSLDVPLRNTTPSSALAETRTAQASPPSTRVAPASSLSVNSQGWVPTGGKMSLSLEVKGKPTSTGEPGIVVPLIGQPGIIVTWSAPRSGDGSLSSTTNPTTTYTAPTSIKHVFHVVNLNVTVSGPTPLSASARLTVIRRRWYLDLRFVTSLVCGGSNKDYALSYDNLATARFRINDDLSVVLDGPVAGAPPATINLTSCNSCRATKKASPSEIKVTSGVSLFLRYSGFVLVGSVTVTDAVPPVAMTCDPPLKSYDVPGDNYETPIPGVWPLSNRLETSPPGPSAVPIWLNAAWESVP